MGDRTKGPWLAHENQYCFVVRSDGVVLDSLALVAHRVDRRADAHLIAAAPEMYDALFALCEYLRHTPAGSKTDTKAYALFSDGQAALEKALGEA